MAVKSTTRGAFIESGVPSRSISESTARSDTASAQRSSARLKCRACSPLSLFNTPPPPLQPSPVKAMPFKSYTIKSKCCGHASNGPSTPSMNLQQTSPRTTKRILVIQGSPSTTTGPSSPYDSSSQRTTWAGSVTPSSLVTRSRASSSSSELSVYPWSAADEAQRRLHLDFPRQMGNTARLQRLAKSILQR